ncbi:MAG TPA: alpha-amylase family glycosyl hydrolase [Pyrinomonadaceae bacterium]|nr:alpha-amylase family glycosyl hydrolase [Pyrinomonadaceae bacterium]
MDTLKTLIRTPGLRMICLGVCALGAAGACLAVTPSNAPAVTKVEPPSWWANQSINPVRLLVRGANLNGARVVASRPQTAVAEVKVNANGTYLFVSVRIGPSAQPGAYPLSVITPDGTATIPFQIDSPLNPAMNFRGVTTDDVIYLIMTDRFSDGDPTNNAPAGSPPEANDRRNSRAFHGGDIRGVINHLSYLKELGVTAIWLTPWYDNWDGVNNCDRPWCPNTSYHGYGAIDYYGIESHFGDLGTVQELVRKAHALGLKVIQDQVANHVGSHHPWMTDPPLDDWFHGTRQHHLIEKFQNSALLTPHGNRDEVRNTLDGWFSEDLPDMNQEEPEVARYEIQNALWWIGVSGIDGIRQDTIQYMPRSFIRDLSNPLHRQYPKMWMVGEVFERDAAQTAFFIGGRTGWDGIDTKLDSDFDFSLWQVALDVFTGKKPMRALRDQLKYDALYPDPLKITTLTNNHDTPRFMSLDSASLEGAMLHTAFMLAVRGTPQLYSGEEIAMKGKEDPDNRRDFPGGFSGDSRSAFQANTRSAEQQRMWQWTHDWIKLRLDHSALRDGRLIDLFYDDDIYAFARQDKKEMVVLVFNRANAEKNITVPAAAIDVSDGLQLLALYGAKNSGRVTGGVATLAVPARTAAAYRIQ